MCIKVAYGLSFEGGCNCRLIALLELRNLNELGGSKVDIDFYTLTSKALDKNAAKTLCSTELGLHYSLAYNECNLSQHHIEPLTSQIKQTLKPQEQVETERQAQKHTLFYQDPSLSQLEACPHSQSLLSRRKHQREIFTESSQQVTLSIEPADRNIDKEVKSLFDPTAPPAA